MVKWLDSLKEITKGSRGDNPPPRNQSASADWRMANVGYPV